MALFTTDTTPYIAVNAKLQGCKLWPLVGRFISCLRELHGTNGSSIKTRPTQCANTAPNVEWTVSLDLEDFLLKHGAKGVETARGSGSAFGSGQCWKVHPSLQTQAQHLRKDQPHHRFQRGNDGGEKEQEEYRLNRVGRWWTGAYETTLEELPPGHRGSCVRGGQFGSETLERGKAGD